jgi:hypothetical protein
VAAIRLRRKLFDAQRGEAVTMQESKKLSI